MKKLSKKYRTDFLFINPNFLIGLGSTLNIAGNYFLYNYSDSDEIADSKAIASDWGVIGLDIKNSLNFYKNNRLR